MESRNMNKKGDLQVGDLVIGRKDGKPYIVLEVKTSVGQGYGRKKFANHRYAYLLISHNGKKKWWKDVEIRVKFKIPQE